MKDSTTYHSRIEIDKMLVLESENDRSRGKEEEICPMRLDFEQIKEYLPQRFPFLMVDKVIEYKPEKRIITIKNITGNEIFFQGHFPERAIMPGALILEGMSQTAILFFKLSQSHLKKKQAMFLFGGVKAKFMKPVVPGEILIIKISPVKIIKTGGIMKGIVMVEDTIVAKAELSFSVKDIF